MSGGHFDYNQFKIEEIADKIQRVLDIKSDDECEYTGAIEDPAVRVRLRHAINALKIAFIYAHRIDWLFSGDDSEESFCQRLDEELDKSEALIFPNSQEGENEDPNSRGQ